MSLQCPTSAILFLHLGIFNRVSVRKKGITYIDLNIVIVGQYRDTKNLSYGTLPCPSIVYQCIKLYAKLWEGSIRLINPCFAIFHFFGTHCIGVASIMIRLERYLKAPQRIISLSNIFWDTLYFVQGW